MKRYILSLACLFLFGACSKFSQEEVVKTTYYHAYGPQINAVDWKDQGSSGEVVELLKNEVEIRKEYKDGVLHGTCSWTFPHSKIAERIEEYIQGKRILTGKNFENGSPESEEELIEGNKRIVHAWYGDGSPRVLEEYYKGHLIEGKYFTLEGEIESSISAGNGLRVERSHTGQLTTKEEVRSGDIRKRESFYPNGQLREVVLLQGNKKHGESHSYAENGQTVAIENWTFNLLDGTQILFEKGLLARQVPYVLGKKDGKEIHFQLGTEEIIAEISWHNDQLHGISKSYIASRPMTEWYWKDGKVTENQYRARIEGTLITSR